MNEAFGIMDQAYFISRGEILAWINTTFKLNLTKVEELGSGAVYCQILDAMYPGKVLFNKVNWKAKNDYEFNANLKLLQQGFIKVGIKKHLEIEKLAKCRYQDNLEMIQWLKRFFDSNGGISNDYDPVERRKSVLDFSFAQKIVKPKVYNGQGQVINNTEKEVQSKKSISRQEATKSKENQNNNTLLNQQSVNQQKMTQSSLFFDKDQNLQENKQMLRIQQLEQSYKHCQDDLNHIKNVLMNEQLSSDQMVMQLNSLLGLDGLYE